MFKKSVKTNLIFNSIYQLTSILVPLVTMPYLSRILHAEGLGTYSYAYSISYYFYLFIRLGLNNYGNRTIAYIKDDRQALSLVFSEIFVFQFINGLIFSGLYLAYAFLFAQNQLLALLFTTQVIAGCIDFTWLLYGLEEFGITSVRDIMTRVLTTLCIFAFVKGPEDVWKYALIYGAGILASNLVVLPSICSRVRFVTPTVQGVLRHVKPNIILFLPTVAVSIYKTMDKIMLGSMTTDMELGFYHSVENIIKVPLALVTALGTVMLPRMSNMIFNGEKKENIEETFEKSYIFAAFITSSTCFGMMAVAKEFVPIFYGEGFEKCITLFYIILPSCLFVGSANVIRTQYLIPQKRDVLFVASLFSGAIVNVVLNYILIPRYASIGAAIGTLLAEIVVCLIQSIGVYREINMNRNIVVSLPAIVSGLVMYLTLYNKSIIIGNPIVSLFVKVLCGAAVYMLIYISGTAVIKRVILRRYFS